jgi:predicted O-linked N-acetylglucosamine transferase (SPINDLY family)
MIDQIVQRSRLAFTNGQQEKALKILESYKGKKSEKILKSKFILLTAINKFDLANRLMETNFDLVENEVTTNFYLLNKITIKNFELNTCTINIVKKDYMSNWILLGIIFAENKGYEKSIEFLARCNLKNMIPEAVAALSISLAQLNKTEEIKILINELITDKDKIQIILKKTADVFLINKNFTQALYFYNELSLIETDDETIFGIACCNNELGDILAAKDLFERIKTLEKPKFYWSCCINLGTIYTLLEKNDVAIENYMQAISVDPSNCLSYYNLAMIYTKIGKWEEALKINKKSIELSDSFLPSIFLDYKIKRRLFIDVASISEDILSSHFDKNESLMAHHDFNWIMQNQNNQLKYAESFYRNKIEKQLFKFREGISCYLKKKTKEFHVAFVTPDMHPSHPVGRIALRLDDYLKELGIKRTVINSLPFQYEKNWSLIKESFDNWVDIYSYENGSPIFIESKIMQLRSMQPDVVIDLSGFTSHTLKQIFYSVKGDIPIVHAFGFPGTMGGLADYVWADEFVIRKNEVNNYSEKVIYSNHCHLPIHREAGFSIANAKNVLFGLNSTDILLGCFNDFYKISHATFDVWLTLLAEAPNRYLVLRKSSPEIQNTIAKMAVTKGVQNEQIIYYDRKPNRIDYLKMFAALDLYLDTESYSAGSIAVEATSYCVPIITFNGKTWISRIAGSVLNHVGKNELIVNNYEEYLILARNIINDRVLSRKIRMDLLARFEPQRDLEYMRSYAKDFTSKLKAISNF